RARHLLFDNQILDAPIQEFTLLSAIVCSGFCRTITTGLQAAGIDAIAHQNVFYGSGPVFGKFLIRSVGAVTVRMAANFENDIRVSLLQFLYKSRSLL